MDSLRDLRRARGFLGDFHRDPRNDADVVPSGPLSKGNGVDLSHIRWSCRAESALGAQELDMVPPSTTVLDPMLEKLEREAPPAMPPPPPDRGGRDGEPFRPRRVETLPPPVSNAVLAMLAVIVFESM